ncbi:hypothetical protein JCM11251_003179 [Rhodosporidiobolus azoricus]
MFRAFFDWIRSLFWSTQLDVAIIGLQAAGKTSLVNVLTHNEFTENMIPTVGFNLRKVQKGNVTLKVWDLAGQPRFRSIWERYCRGVNAIVWVLDSSDSATFPTARAELQSLLEKPELAGIPLLVLGNKNDVPEHASIDEIIKALGLRSIVNREVSVYSISAKSSRNIDITLACFSAPQTIRIPSFASPTPPNKLKAPQTREEERAARTAKSGNQQWQSLDAFAASEGPTSLVSLLKRGPSTSGLPPFAHLSPVRQPARSVPTDPIKHSTAARRQSQAVEEKESRAPPRRTNPSDESSRNEPTAPLTRRARRSPVVPNTAAARKAEEQESARSASTLRPGKEEREKPTAGRPSLARGGPAEPSRTVAPIQQGRIPPLVASSPSTHSKQLRASSAAALPRQHAPPSPSADPAPHSPLTDQRHLALLSSAALPPSLGHGPSPPFSPQTAEPVAGPSRPTRAALPVDATKGRGDNGSLPVQVPEERHREETVTLEKSRRQGRKRVSTSLHADADEAPTASVALGNVEMEKRRPSKVAANPKERKGKKVDAIEGDESKRDKRRGTDARDEAAQEQEQPVGKKPRLRKRKALQEDEGAEPPISGPPGPRNRRIRLSSQAPFPQADTASPSPSPDPPSPEVALMHKRRRSKQDLEQDGQGREKQVKIVTERSKGNVGRLNVFDIVAGGAKKLLDRSSEDISDPRTLDALTRFSRSFRSSLIARSSCLTALASSHSRLSTAKTCAKKYRLELLDVQRARAAVQVRMVQAEREWAAERKEVETTSILHDFLAELQEASSSWR